MTNSRTLLALAVLAAAPPVHAFDPVGGLDFTVAGLTSAGASFDAERVVGPIVNMSRQEEGGWAGDLNGNDMPLAVTPKKLSGAGVSLQIDRSPDALSIEGLFFSHRVRIELTGKKLTGRYGACSFDLKKVKEGLYVGDTGCLRNRTLPTTGQATFRLVGVAASSDVPMPQLALGLLAVLPY